MEWSGSPNTRKGRKPLCLRLLVALVVLVALAGASTGGSVVAARAGSNTFSLSTMSPGAGSTVAGNVVWQVGYTGATPQKVRFYVDGTLKWTEYAAPFVFNGDNSWLDTSRLAAGSHTLKAVGYLSTYSAQTKITVVVSSSGSDGSATAPTITSSPAISGSAVTGKTLSASTGTWSGSPTSYAYQWQRCDSSGSNCQLIPGASAQTYLPSAADVGQTMRVSVTATNGSGSSQPAYSAVTAVVRADLALGQPASASSFQNSSYTPDKANDGTLSSRWSSAFADNQWWQVDLGSVMQVDTVALNWETAYASSYKIQASTDGVTFTVAASVSNSSAGWKTTTFGPVSARYVRVLGVTRATGWGFSFWDAQVFGGGAPVSGAPANTSAPTVSGVAVAGQTLTASIGSWSGTDPISYAYSWLRCPSATDLSSCAGISGATTSSYTAGTGDVGVYLRVSVVASNPIGSAAAVSAPSAQVASSPAPPPSSGFDPRTAWLRAPWNADAAAASVDPNSAALISTWIARGNIKYPNLLTNSWSQAWVNGAGSAPHYDISVVKWGIKTIYNVPIPTGTKPSADSDAHLAIFDLEHGREIDLWQAAFDGTKWQAGTGDVYSPLGSDPKPGTGSNAAGFPALALAVWPEEIQAGEIRHALGFSVLKAAPSHVYPATKHDGMGDLSDLPEGAWLALPTSLAPKSSWPAWVKVVFKALQQHGMFLMDQGGTLGIAGVNPINGGVKWSDVGMGSGGSAGFPSDFPWTSMRVLNPPSAS